MAVTIVAFLAACDDSGDDGRPRRSSTSSSSTTASSSTSTSTTAPAIPPPAPPPTTPPVDAGTCGAQTDAIVAAINATDLQGLNTRAGQFTVQACRLAASSPIWAAAETVANPGVALPRYTVVLQRIGALWTVLSVAEPGQFNCDVPPEVKSDLALSC